MGKPKESPEPEIHEPHFYTIDLEVLHSKSIDRIGDLQTAVIKLTCWAIDARDAIHQAEEAAAEQNIHIERVTNAVDTGIPISAHIEPKAPISMGLVKPN